MSSHDKLTKEMVEAILAYIAEAALDQSLLVSIGRVAAAVIESEAAIASELLGMAEAIDYNLLTSEWISRMPLRMAGINNTTEASLRRLLEDALAKGQSVTTVVDRIVGMFGSMDAGRALLISRQEILGASNFAAFRVYQIAGIPMKRWVSTQDDRVRDSHAEAHGQIVEITEPFDVGGAALMYPGDPAGPAKEVCNCRCWTVPELDGRSIWTEARVIAIWRGYVRRAVEWDSRMTVAVRTEFYKQKDGVLYILRRSA
jgi:hypothetical protein